MSQQQIQSQLATRQPGKFDYLNGIGSGGCTDLDVLLERFGRFLVHETKRPGDLIPKGQLIALRELALLPNWTVWVVVGHPPADIHTYAPLGSEQRPINVRALRELTQMWWEWASANPWRKAA